jgi:thiamine pyrophosphokinase
VASTRVLIFANGLLPDPARARALVRPEDFVISADGGTRHALALGLKPAVIIGDLDSLLETDHASIESPDVSVIAHSPDKDETDVELALQYALQQKPSAIMIVGALGGRLDQTLANVSLLADPTLAGADVRLDDGVEAAFFCWDSAKVEGRHGDLVSLLPWGGPTAGVHTDGLRWPLRGETLYAARTRGISNEMTGDSAQVRIESGLLLIIHRRGL